MTANPIFVCPRCTQCKQPIFNQVLTMADGKIYHTYHFQCSSCHNVLTASYTTHSGQIYCTDCHKSIMKNVCAICNKPVEENCLKIMNFNYHFKCFKCSSCGETFDDGVFYPVGDEIYCVHDHWDARMELEREEKRKLSKAFDRPPSRKKFKRPK